MADDAASAVAAAAETASNESGKKLPMTHQDSLEDKVCYRVTRRVFSKSVTSKLHILFKKILAGSLKTLKVTRISAMYTNFLHPPVHSGPSKFSRPKI